MIEFKNVTKTYFSKKVLDDISFKINDGDFLCIVGSSGSGKTTLMKMINGLVTADIGSVYIDEKNIKDENLAKLRRKIGYSLQGNCLFPHMTIYENIAYVLNLEKKDYCYIEENVDKMLDLVKLDKSIKKLYPNNLSGGQQQRVSIARACANSPKILLMDEPFGALDSITRYKLQNELKQIHKRRACTIIFITHDIAEAFKLSTHIMVINNGKIEQYGTKDEIRKFPKTQFVKDLIEMAKY